MSVMRTALALSVWVVWRVVDRLSILPSFVRVETYSDSVKAHFQSPKNDDRKAWKAPLPSSSQR